MATNTSGGSTSSFYNTPQATDDCYTRAEDGTYYFDVMADDLGGNAKILWSIDDTTLDGTGGGTGDGTLDLTIRDLANVANYSDKGARIWVTTDGKVGYDASIFNYLGANDTACDKFTYAIRLSNGTLSWATVTITITGSNDGPAINSAATGFDVTGAVTEKAEPNEGGTLSDSGLITFSDVDATDHHTASFAAQGSGYLGTFALVDADLATAGIQTAPGSVGWSFSVDDSALDYLAAGQQLVQKYDVTVDDGHGGTAIQTVTVTITGTNDKPALSGTAATLPAGTEDTAYTVTAAQLLQGWTDVDGETLSVTGLTATNGSVVANMDGSYTITPTANFNGAVTLNYNVTDGTAPVATSLSYTLNAVDDAPVNSVPGAQSVDEDNALVFSTGNGNAVSISDVDAGTDAVQTTLSVGHGTLTLGSLAGLTLTGGANGTSTVTVQGTLTAINTALQGLSYQGASNFNGSDSLSIVTSDLGHNGSGGPLTDSDSVAITVNAVNDAPVATIIPTTLSATENVSLDLKMAGLSISDVDANGQTVTVTLSVGEGALNGTAGNSNVALSGNGSSTLTITGLVSEVNAFLGAIGSSSTLAYVDNSDTPGASTTLTLSVNDNGHSGAGGPLSSSDTATINITAVNDAPVNTIPASFTTNEDASVKLAGLAVSDADAGSAPISVTLGVGSGLLSAATAGGVTVTGSGTGSLVLSGSQADINAYLASSANQPTYTPAANANGAVTLTMTTSDGGATGSGGTKTDTDTSTINITSVNDAPAGTDGTVTTIEDMTKVFAASDFGFTDPSDSPANAFLAVKIVTLPGAGILKLDGVAVTAGQFISATDINAGKLAFVPTPDVAGTTSLTFQVQDNGGTANGGIDLDQSANTLIIEITPVNDAPVNTIPGAQSATAGTALSIGGVSVFDSDSGNLTTTLSVAHGTVHVGSVVGVTITGNDTGTVQLTGDQFSINQALTGLSYTATGGYTGADSLSVNTSDGSLSDNDSVGITVTAPAGDPNDFDNQLAGNAAANPVNIADDPGASTLHGSNSADTIHAGNGSDTVYGHDGDDQIFGEGASDTSLYGQRGNDTISGGVGADTIYGGSGDDILYGYQAPANATDNQDNSDTIYGGSGNDSLFGQTNNDILIGGYGADQLTGADGSDVFQYWSVNDAGDTITDFTQAGTNGNDSFQFRLPWNDGTFSGGFAIANQAGAGAATMATLTVNATTGVITGNMAGADVVNLTSTDPTKLDSVAEIDAILKNAGGTFNGGVLVVGYDPTGNVALYYDADANDLGGVTLLAHLTGVTSTSTIVANDFAFIL